MLKNTTNTKANGWIGLAVCCDTLLLKNICKSILNDKSIMEVDYSMDIMWRYIQQVHAKPLYISKMYEFGTKEAYKRLNK